MAKQLVPMDEFGMFADKKDTARCDSRFVAQTFDKRHADVLRDIERITDPDSGLSEEFTQRNFAFSTYKDSTGRKLPCYCLTRDGFTILAMGFTGAKANRFKEQYINRFNDMESFIKDIVSARNEFPLLTANINLLHEKPQPYHFSNECDMLNSIAVGCSAKKFRELHNIQKGTSIRPFMRPEQIELLYVIQNIDIGLLVSTPDYYQRKDILQQYAERWLMRHTPLIEQKRKSVPAIKQDTTLVYQNTQA